MEFNIGNSIFNGFNDSEGLMLCGYEWGNSKKDQYDLEKSGKDNFIIDGNAITTFSNKVPKFGDRALTWLYDNRIQKWFSLWGNPLSADIFDPFSKTILQTNWCNTCNNDMSGQNISVKCLLPESIDNFIYHLSSFKPKVIIFLGSKLKYLIKHESVSERFLNVVGNEIKPSKILKKEFSGRCFYVSFSYFSKCTVICFPHPSSSRGLSDNYIKLFDKEMNEILNKFKNEKKLR